MIRVILAALAGAVIMFLWGMISWMFLPFHEMTINQIEEDKKVVQSLEKHLPQTGVYLFPSFPGGKNYSELTKEEQKDFVERHQQGPIGMVVYVKEGANPLSAKTMVQGILISFVSALLAALLLLLTLPGNPGYLKRVLTVSLLGVFAALVSHVALWNWSHFPLDYTLAMSFDLVAGWFLSGLAIAGIVKAKEREK